MSHQSTRQAKPPSQFTHHSEGARIVVIDGPDTGRSVLAGARPVVIGSASGCALVLGDPLVSRRHLRVKWTGKWLDAHDMGSKNGSFSAGNRFERLSIGLGSSFRVGQTTCKVVPEELPLDAEALERDSYGGLIGKSAAMGKLYALIDRVAPSDAAVLIQGETGSGKEMVAEELHRHSPRRDGPFVIFDCGAVPEELIESTLFGHLRGSFTGAVSDRPGIFAEANGGTVFLDEIGELRRDLQPALLRVLDRGQIRPIGQSSYQSVDVRVIAATHRDLRTMIGEKQFREDLYYRLSVVRLAVPPLRQRRGDIPLLLRHFLRRFGSPHVHVDPGLVRVLDDYNWPGNVRELANVIESGLAFASDGTITAESLQRTGYQLPLIGKPSRQDGQKTADSAIDQARDNGGDRDGGDGGDGDFADDAPDPAQRSPAEPRQPFKAARATAISEFERTYLVGLMAEYSSLSQASRAAQIDRKQLRVLLRRYGLWD